MTYGSEAQLTMALDHDDRARLRAIGWMRFATFGLTAIVAPFVVALPHINAMAVTVGVVALLQPVYARVVPANYQSVGHLVLDTLLVTVLAAFVPELWTIALLVTISSMMWLTIGNDRRAVAFIVPFSIAALTALALYSRPPAWAAHLAVAAVIVAFSLERGRMMRRSILTSRTALEESLAEAGALVYCLDLSTGRLRWFVGDPAPFVSMDNPNWEKELASRVHRVDLSEHEGRVRAAQPGEIIDGTLRIRDQQGEWRWFRDKSRVMFTVRGGPVLRGYLTDVTEAERSRLAVTAQARQDYLTGLPNRLVLDERLAELARKDVPRAVLLLDLNGFKEVNDTLGHSAGDAVLRELADRLGSFIRQPDLLCRLGSDEFAVVVTAKTDAFLRHEPLADRIQSECHRPVQIWSLALPISLSIGIAVGRGQEAPLDTMRRADIALHESKARRTAYEVFDHEMDKFSLERLRLESSLRGALERGEFRVVYQPKVDLATGSIVGCEALARWQHPTLGLLLPGQFLEPLSISSDFQKFSDFVVSTVVRTIAEFAGMGIRLPVAVNIPASSLRDRRFAGRLLTKLTRSGVPPSLLTLEVTEAEVVRNYDETAETVEQLRQAGLRFSIDDFGTGYSSLERLRDLRVDELKLDRSFVTPLPASGRDRVIVQSMIELALGLETDVVAEGVETEIQAQALRSMGCRTAQGFLYYRPLPLEDLIDAVAVGTVPHLVAHEPPMTESIPIRTSARSDNHAAAALDGWAM